MPNTMTQYHTGDVKRDDTRDEGYDLYALIGACQRALSHITTAVDVQQNTLQEIAEHLSVAKDFARAFVAQRKSM